MNRDNGRQKTIHMNDDGFTLMEIIIVVIIVGVLASLALPRFSNTIELARSVEALNVMGGLRRAAVRCNMAREATTGFPNNYANCVTWDQLSTEDPGLVPGAIFDYAATYNAPNWTCVATRKGVGAAVGHTVTMQMNTTTGNITRTGTGPYAFLN